MVGHMASAVGKQRGRWTLYRVLSTFIYCAAHGTVPLTLRVCLALSVNPITSHRCAQGFVSLVIFHLAKQTTNADCHTFYLTVTGFLPTPSWFILGYTNHYVIKS